jgi:hypothetical protein
MKITQPEGTREKTWKKRFIREKTYTLPITLPITLEVPTGSVPREKTAMKTDDPNHPYIQTITSNHPFSKNILPTPNILKAIQGFFVHENVRVQSARKALASEGWTPIYQLSTKWSADKANDRIFWRTKAKNLWRKLCEVTWGREVCEPEVVHLRWDAWHMTHDDAWYMLQSGKATACLQKLDPKL